MDTEAEPEIIFSALTQTVAVDGHRFEVEIYKASGDHGWILSVENVFGTLTISDNPPFLSDLLAWRAFEELVDQDGAKAFFSRNERRKLGL